MARSVAYVNRVFPGLGVRATVARRSRRLRTRSRVAQTVVAAALLLGFGLAHVWVRLQVAEVGYGLAAAREVVARLELEQKELEAELATLTAPRRLEGAARQRLGMHEPRPGQVMVLR